MFSVRVRLACLRLAAQCWQASECTTIYSDLRAPRRFYTTASRLLKRCITTHPNLRAPRRFYTTSSKSLKRCGAGWQPAADWQSACLQRLQCRRNASTVCGSPLCGAGWQPVANRRCHCAISVSAEDQASDVETLLWGGFQPALTAMKTRAKPAEPPRKIACPSNQIYSARHRQQTGGQHSHSRQYNQQAGVLHHSRIVALLDLVLCK